MSQKKKKLQEKNAKPDKQVHKEYKSKSQMKKMVTSETKN